MKKHKKNSAKDKHKDKQSVKKPKIKKTQEREMADDEYSSSAGYGGWGHDE